MATWKSNAATGKATSCAATARASANGLCVTAEALKRPLPAPFDACDKQGTRVDSLSLVRYRTNDYSVPVAYGHQEVWIRGYVHEVVIGAAPGSLPDTPVPTTGKTWSSIRSTTAFAGAQDRCPGSGRAAGRLGTA